MEYIMREVRRTDAYNMVLDLCYFTKGLACDTMDGLEEGAPGVLALLERAGKKGLDWLAQAMEGIDAAAQMVMEMLRRAAETGEEFVDIAVEMLASYWGFRNRPGQESESGVCETELVQMVAKDSPCPTE